MAKGIYETVIVSHMAGRDISAATLELHRRAYECDDARAKLIDSALYAANVFANIAEDVRIGCPNGSNPMSCSAVYEMPALVARLEERREAFLSCLRATQPESTYKAIKFDIAAAFAALDAKLPTADEQGGEP